MVRMTIGFMGEKGDRRQNTFSNRAANMKLEVKHYDEPHCPKCCHKKTFINSLNERCTKCQHVIKRFT